MWLNKGMTAGIRALKDHLSDYIRRVEQGERVAVTVHGRVVAELVPPAAHRAPAGSRLSQLVEAGLVQPPEGPQAPFDGWPDIRLPAGTATRLVDEDRGET
jgi:prevent-host-death family protein